MMIITMLILGAVIGAYAWWARDGMQPIAQEPLTPELTRRLIDALMYRGIGRTRLSIRVKDDQRELVLAKYVRDPGDAGLSTQLPRTPIMEPYWQPLRAELTRRGIAFVESEQAGNQPPTMSIDFGLDLDLARSVVYIVFEQIFAVSLNTDCVAYFNEHLLAFETAWLTGVRRSAG